MKIKMDLKGRVIKGEKHYKLVSFDLLKYDDLPQDYLDDIPHVSADSPGTKITLWFRGEDPWHEKGHHKKCFYIGHCYHENKIEHLINQLSLAAERLKTINSQLEKENKGWEGHTRTIVI